MNQALNFQSIMMKLQEFWAGQGCLIWQPYYTQVGAGTMNPATFLRVLGPEPWRVGYVEPSIRPDDGRYGENPNRMQMHYQFQVIIKPDPGNPQDIYLKSLEALGIDPRRHDIRFVEDNWEQPALGAWGLGWEVWLDGQEITQYTYFQQAGGVQLDPVSVEITYGLERIAMALQDVDSFRDIRWNSILTDGDVNLQAEQEHSQYYFEGADVARLRQMYELFDVEARACLERGLVLPAYDYVLKCSHTFNVLDTRGAVGVTERQAIFARTRELARMVSEVYLEGRQRLEYPWLDLWGGEHSALKAHETRDVATGKPLQEPAPFLLEVGTEELPASDLNAALEQLWVRVPGLLDELRLEHGEVRIMGTPRRLVVFVEELAPRQLDMEQAVKGPPAERAFDSEGHPTQAAQGFARSKGVAVEHLQVREMDGGRYAVAVVRQVGRSASEVLTEALPGLIAGLRFDRGMRWNSTNVFFSRPIRWLLALHDQQVIHFEYAGLRSGNRTRGLRFRQPTEFTVESPVQYFERLQEQGIILDVAERQRSIQSQIEALAIQANGEIAQDMALLSEVTNLVEAPTALLGSFDSSYLSLPLEVLVSVMKKHQRYFPIQRPGVSQLRPYFIAVRNGDGDHLDIVRKGNEHVIRARFADAAYFVREDMQKPLESFLPRLDTLTFQAKLGSMLDKTQRVVAMIDQLAAWCRLDEEQISLARRAALLCKADLTTQMVVEMTSLQGVLGRYYALNSGEPDEVATAIYEHYLPRYAGDSLPKSGSGLVVGLADRLDSLVGLFAAGLAPSGSKDPFGLRRAALGVVQNLIVWEMDFDLRPALKLAASNLPIQADNDCQSAVLEFILERLRNLLLERGDRYDVVDAVLEGQGWNPAKAAQASQELGKWVLRRDWHEILPAYSRCVRITRDLEQRYPINPDQFIEPAERELYQALEIAEGEKREAGAVDDFMKAFLPMMPSINLFFDQVLVMSEDRSMRENRLGLLQRIVALAEGVADMSRLEGF